MQTRIASLLECFHSTWIGLCITTALQFLLVGPYVFHASHTQNTLSVTIFTFSSLVRGYGVRRWHANGHSLKQVYVKILDRLKGAT